MPGEEGRTPSRMQPWSHVRCVERRARLKWSEPEGKATGDPPGLHSVDRPWRPAPSQWTDPDARPPHSGQTRMPGPLTVDRPGRPVPSQWTDPDTRPPHSGQTLPTHLPQWTDPAHPRAQ